MTDREVGAEFVAGCLGGPELPSKCGTERPLCLDLHSAKTMHNIRNSRPSDEI